ncbi:SRPBCC family protein [Marinibaculum pumilum]|uniref:SRPBCC family protein n=1 Tax=Marinibaculum pumilum TaxID=1766165 RepID=A0ABV7KZS7_9PROT
MPASPAAKADRRDAEAGDPRDLVLSRFIPAPPPLLYRCWSEPDLLKRFFCPRPWSVSHAVLDLRPGGSCRITMCDPQGKAYPNDGVYLEVVPNRRLVFTDAYTAGWRPSEKPFMTGIIDFVPEGGGTRYTACARHWTAADRQSHLEMGFEEGWGIVAHQLAELAATL